MAFESLQFTEWKNLLYFITRKSYIIISEIMSVKLRDDDYDDEVKITFVKVIIILKVYESKKD